MAKRKGKKGQTTIYIKLKIEKHEPHYKSGMNTGAPEGLDPYTYFVMYGRWITYILSDPNGQNVQ